MGSRRLIAGLLGLARMPLVVLVADPAAAGAAPAVQPQPPTVVVGTRADDGSPQSLRGVLDMVNADGGPWRIELLAGEPYMITRLCQSGPADDNHGGDLDVTTNADVAFVAAPGTVATIAVGCVGERIVDHFGTGVLGFERIRLTGGNTANGAKGDQADDRSGRESEPGGAIRSVAMVRLHESIVEGNSTGNGGNGAPSLVPGIGGRGGSVGRGAAVAAESVQVSRSIIRNNHGGNGGNGANGVGAGMRGGHGGSGAGSTLAGESVSVYLTEISGNTAGDGGKGGSGLGAGSQGGRGGSGGHGAGASAARVEIIASTVSGNVSGNGGAGGAGNGAAGGDGGFGGGGGGASADGGLVARSTIHGNAAGVAGPPGNGTPNGTSPSNGDGGGVVFSSGENQSHIIFSTVTANAAAEGANLNVANTRVRYSVVGEGTGGSNCKHPVSLEDFSVADDESCGPTPYMLDPLGLGPLADNGGRTQTRLPLPGSALGALIPADVCAAFEDGADQRGERRPIGGCEPGAVEVPPPAASKFVPLPPQRVFDTRVPGPAAGFVGAGETVTVQFAGIAGIPPVGATAVAFNLTVANAAGPGFVTAWESGNQRPLASSANTVRAGQIVPNMVIVPIGPSGRIDFFSQTGSHLVADVMGYFVQAPVAAAGRIVPLPPARLFDTRELGSGFAKLPPGGSVTIDVTGRSGIPATGVAAVVINVTGTEADAAGFVTVQPGAGPTPLASTLNLDGPGHTAANLTIVPVGMDGTITLFSQSGAHLLADVTGYVTDASAPKSGFGLMVPVRPERLFDTRDDGAPVGAGATIERNAVIGELTNAAAVVINLTATEAMAPGFVTGYPAGPFRPLASTLNLTEPGETRPNAAILPVGEGGMIAYFSQSGTHLVADVFGYIVPPPLEEGAIVI